MIRNSLIFLFVFHYIYQIYINFKYRKNFKSKFSLKKNLILIFFLTSSVLLTNLGYAKDFISSNKIYDLNVSFFVPYLDFFPSVLTYFFSIILNFVTHLFLLLGFREQAYTEFLFFFSNQNNILEFYILVGFFMFLFHAIGFFYFIKSFISKYPFLISLLIYLIPNLFLVSHMRYFMPMMPLSILGICLLMQKNIISLR